MEQQLKRKRQRLNSYLHTDEKGHTSRVKIPERREVLEQYPSRKGETGLGLQTIPPREQERKQNMWARRPEVGRYGSGNCRNSPLIASICSVKWEIRSSTDSRDSNDKIHNLWEKQK